MRETPAPTARSTATPASPDAAQALVPIAPLTPADAPAPIANVSMREPLAENSEASADGLMTKLLPYLTSIARHQVSLASRIHSTTTWPLSVDWIEPSASMSYWRPFSRFPTLSLIFLEWSVSYKPIFVAPSLKMLPPVVPWLLSSWLKKISSSTSGRRTLKSNRIELKISL
ncbi:hypothetical protein PC129_g6522 [Phytophthora cactorum]|uniref:Uncharacterized protein n=1 Tax=Phytophthora cactorum TaxID=29920 RepID=A0A329SHW1_9STRA|nr:hypothetical protein Pcac1_g24608 [Phytophthora cactorum]KAG2828702.1 hypothetical protein PC112_g8370 [Phytophthora cactorum]KAG2847637.1 hypothetical protein PC111_g762 [Phytophthora cactorum]KAG2859678.1 hypothetical protein PC113_g8709 [Phytophthora cactorum]KAG2927131.1 hypothetical protein PC115_g7665 [Phytophthora cactorum]